MIIRIDTTSSVPVYAQIVEQMKRAIASGSLQAGEGLPSLRETAIKLRVNPLTVGKAYKLLEQEGLIETKHGLGSFVTTNGGIATDEYRHDALSRSIDNLLVDAHHLGVSQEELKDLFEERVRAAGDGFATDQLWEKHGNDE